MLLVLLVSTTVMLTVTAQNGDCSMDFNTSFATCMPKIDTVHPSSGPVNGGTLLTITGTYIGNVTDSISVDVSGVRCHNVKVVKPETNLTCVIGKGSTTQTYGMFISVNANNFSDSNTTYFRFKEAMISEFSPKKGVVSGGTTVVIEGSDLEFEGQNRYNISFCNNDTCIHCSAKQKTISSKSINCKTGKSGEVRNMTKLQIVIDDLTVLTLNKTFQYLPDPTFEHSNESRNAMQSGGATFTICSEGFTNVGQITVQRVVKPCDVPENTSTVCETPYKIQNQSNEQTICVRFDGVILPINIVYVDVPTFERFSGVLGYDQGSSIKIKGINILTGAHREDYSVHIGLDGLCLITDINMQFIICLPPKSVPRTNKTDENTVHVIVVVSMITAYIGDLQYTEADNKSSLVNALLTGGLVTSVFIGIMAVLISRRNKKIAIKKCNMEMSKDLSYRRKKSRKDNELGHFEDSETPYSEINPVAELNSYSSIVGQQDVNTGYEKLGHRSPRPTNPYNHLQQSVTDNQMPDTTNIDNRTKDLLASDYIDLNI